MDTTEQFLQALTDAHGVAGYEAEVRAVLRGYMAPLGELTRTSSAASSAISPATGRK